MLYLSQVSTDKEFILEVFPRQGVLGTILQNP